MLPPNPASALVRVTDSAEMAFLLGGDSFTGILILLIAKADPDNRARLKTAYPVEVEAYELWQQLAGTMEAPPTRQHLCAALLEVFATQWVQPNPRAQGLLEHWRGYAGYADGGSRA
jgi:hypothetical protein